MLHNLLIVSDVHLARLRPFMMEGGQVHFAAFLGHYAREREDGRPWRLIVNGDLLDFDHQAGSIAERGAEEDALELFHGIVASSREAFVAFARFLDAGHDIVVIPGNHDRDLMWPRVREAFTAAVRVHAKDRASIERLTFRDWFYYEEGRIYAEHGHQHEPDTGLVGMLDPFEHGESPRLRRDLSTWWIADFCPNIPEIAYHVDHTRSPLYYLPIIVKSLAWKAPFLWVKLLSFIFRTIASAGGKMAQPGPRHDEKRAALAKDSGLSVEQLLAIEAVMVAPRIASRVKTAARLHAVPAVLFPIVFGLGLSAAILGSSALAVAALSAFAVVVGINVFVSSRFAGHNVESLRRAAHSIQPIVGTRIVALGHNHAATDEPIALGARYLNSGTWSDPRVPNSYLCVVGDRGEVRSWAVEERTSERAPALAVA